MAKKPNSKPMLAQKQPSAEIIRFPRHRIRARRSAGTDNEIANAMWLVDIHERLLLKEEEGTVAHRHRELCVEMYRRKLKELIAPQFQNSCEPNVIPFPA